MVTSFLNYVLGYEPFQSYAGRPKSSGSNSSILLSRSVASWIRLRSRLSSGIMTTCIPAASAAFTPLGASSNTKHWAKTGEKKNSDIILYSHLDFPSSDGRSRYHKHERKLYNYIKV